MPIDDNAALLVLLARYVQAMETRDIQQKVVEVANASIAQQVSKLSNFQSAFAGFGFEMNEGIWTRVREQVGAGPYAEAINAGKEAATAPVDATVTTAGKTDYALTLTVNFLRPVISKKEGLAASAETSASERASSEEKSAAGSDGKVLREDEYAASAAEKSSLGSTGTADDASPPKVGDAILERLKLASGKGLKAADLRQYYENAFSVKLHEKTIGMTLYRLSKDQLVRRDGRTWYYVAPRDDAQNQVGELEFLK